MKPLATVGLPKAKEYDMSDCVMIATQKTNKQYTIAVSTFFLSAVPPQKKAKPGTIKQIMADDMRTYALSPEVDILLSY